MSGLYRINEAAELEITKIIKEIVNAEEAMWDMQDAFVEDTASVKPKYKDFVALQIIAGPEPTQGLSYSPVAGKKGAFDLSMAYQFTLSVNIYTNNAHLLKAAKLPMLLRSEAYKNKLKAVGLGLWDASNVTDLSVFDETRYNLRSHVDLIFSYISVESNVVIGEIEEFEATGTIGDHTIDIDVHK